MADKAAKPYRIIPGKRVRRTPEQEQALADLRRNAVVIPARSPHRPLGPDWFDDKPPIPGLSLSDLVIEMRG